MRALLVVVAGLVLAMPASAQCTLPPPPGPGVPDAYFDDFFTQNGPGWTGGDSTFSLELPDGTHLWMWSDSYIGTVDPLTRTRSSYLFQAHNSLTIQDQAAGTLTTVGYPPSTSSYFVPRSPANWFWIGDGIVVETSPGVHKLKMLLLEWTGFFNFVGHSMATLSLPGLTIDSLQPIPLTDKSILWGAKLIQDGGFYYLYGIKDPGTADKLPYLARFRSIDDLMKPNRWRFWNATTGQWVKGQANATALAGVPAITNDYTVSKLTADTGPFYLMVGMDPADPPFPEWTYVTTYYSCSPQGPWSARTVVYTTPEAGAPGCRVGNTLTYNPRAHPEFVDLDEVLISYNINAVNPKDLVCADDYRPRFIRVQIPGLTQAAPR